MKRSTAAALSVALIVLLAIVCSGSLGSGSALAGKQQGAQLELRKVYIDNNFLSDSWDLNPRSDISHAVVAFGETGTELYNRDIAKGEVIVFDWKKKQKIRSSDFRNYFSGHPKLSKEECGLKWWELIPNSPFGLINYCGTGFLADGKTLRVEKELPPSGEGLSPRDILFSSSLGNLIIHLNSHNPKENVIRVYDVKNWDMIAEWPAERRKALTLTPDGHNLAVSFKSPRGQAARCGVEIREISTGNLVSSWDLPGNLILECPGQIVYLPDNDQVFVSLPIGGFPNISFWDAQKGTLLRQIKDDYRIGFGGNWMLSPNGRWIVGSMRNLPKYVRRQQDFKIWDVSTGKVVYKTAKTWRGYPVGTNFIWGNYLEFSPDSRYLLHLKFKEFTIYEIIEKP